MPRCKLAAPFSRDASLSLDSSMAEVEREAASKSLLHYRNLAAVQPAEGFQSPSLVVLITRPITAGQRETVGPVTIASEKRKLPESKETIIFHHACRACIKEGYSSLSWQKNRWLSGLHERRKKKNPPFLLDGGATRKPAFMVRTRSISSNKNTLITLMIALPQLACQN